MPNKVLTRAIDRLQGLDWASADVRAILLDNTSTVNDEEDTQYLSGFSTLGEVTGTGYSRQALQNKVSTVDTTNDLVRFSCDALTWGGIDVGYIYALLLYLHVNDDDDSEPLMYFDNTFTVTAAAPAVADDTVIYVDPLADVLPIGTELTFPSAVVATLTAAANAGARSLSVSPLADAISLAATAVTPAIGMPIPTNGDVLTIALPDNLLEIANR